MRKASLMSRYANPGTPEYRQKRMCFSIFLPWLQATQIFPHIVFGCKDKGFMGIWYTTGKVLTKKSRLLLQNIYFWQKNVRRYPIAALP